METKPTPLAIHFSLLALSFIAFIYLINVSTGLNHWYHGQLTNGPLALVGRTLIYVVVPTLAFVDLLRHKTSGRYLALLTFVCSAAGLFREFLDGALLPVRGSIEGFVTLLCFSTSMTLIAITIGLAFTRNVDAWFEEANQPQNDLPPFVPIEYIVTATPRQPILQAQHTFQPVNCSSLQRDISLRSIASDFSRREAAQTSSRL
jgi:hypothetical protein